MIVLIVSFLIPLGFASLIRNLDLYGTGKFHYNAIALFWGMFAFAMAGIIHSGIIANWPITERQVMRLVAPVTEELLKALILFYFVRRADFNYVVDGTIYGFGVGIGFAMLETYQYAISAHELAIPLALVRVSSTNLIHAATSGLVGSALAAGRFERGAKSMLFALGSLLTAMGLHMAFNFMVTEGGLLILAILAGFLSTSLIAVIIKSSLNVQQKWIAETLGMTDRVTTGEAAVVQRIQNMDEVLAPIARQFGPDKASKTESLLYLQAEIGIKRKIAEMTADEKMRASVEEEIKRIGVEMDSVRKAIGPYCMLFVRGVYLARGSRLWDLINERVGAAGPGPAGGGLWSALDRRIKEGKS